MIYDQVDSLRVPDLLNPHLTEDLDCQRSSAILGHGHIRRNNGDLSCMVDLPGSVSPDTDDLLSKRKRIIVQDCLSQGRQDAGRKLSLLKMKRDSGETAHATQNRRTIPPFSKTS